METPPSSPLPTLPSVNRTPAVLNELSKFEKNGNVFSPLPPLPPTPELPSTTNLNINTNLHILRGRVSILKGYWNNCMMSFQNNEKYLYM